MPAATGGRGRAGAQQVETRGLIATVFTHRDTRAGDPDLHTHVAISAKVQTLTGDWRVLDAKPLYAAKVYLSEVYTTSLTARLRAGTEKSWQKGKSQCEAPCAPQGGGQDEK